MAQPRSPRTHARPRQRRQSTRSQPMIWTLIGILLVAVLVGTLWLPIYNRTTPTAGGWPFFYWYQLLWVPVVALVSWVAYLLTKLARDGGSTTTAAATPAPGAPPAPPLSAPTAAAPPDPDLPTGHPPGGPTGPRAGSPAPLPKRVPPRPEEN